MPGRQKTRIGTVVSNKMQSTVVVAVEVMKRHRLYRKTMRRTKRLKAHDEENACRLGDLVRIVETRPLSRDKRWRVAEVLVRGDVAEVAPREVGQEIIEEISVKTRPEEPPKEAAPPPEAPEAAAEEAPPEAVAEEAEVPEAAAAEEEPPEPAGEEPDAALEEPVEAPPEQPEAVAERVEEAGEPEEPSEPAQEEPVEGEEETKEE
jgi:small subunit ribosomal protein S17